MFPIGRMQHCARVLAAIDARLYPDRESRRSYLRRGIPNGEAFVYTNGGGDWASLVISGNQAVVRAFDHESDDSPYARAEEEPDPALTEGMPPFLSPLLEMKLSSLLAHERTWVAWWTGHGWETRGTDDFPAHAFSLTAAEIAERLQEYQKRIPLEQLEGALLGDRDPGDLDLLAL